MGFQDPLDLLRGLKLGREEYCQRLLTMLIVGGPYPRWNSRNAVSPNGTRFLWELDVLCFGDLSWPAPPVFIDEFELPRRHEDEAGAAPDYALLWDDRLLMIELKTEATSHRPVQLPTYLDLAAHHHPGRRIDLCYLTPTLPLDPPALREGARFAHITWDRTIPLLRATWSEATATEQPVLAALLAALDGIGGSWTTWRTERLVEPGAQTPSTIQGVPDVLDEALDLAWLTAADNQQRVLNRPAGHLEDLQVLRLAVRQAICEASDERLHHVMPWIWSAATSGGKALTTSGAETGYELRLSRYRNAVC